MRKAASFISALLVCVLIPSSALAWGAAAHQYITRRAIDLLPPELKPFFEHYRDELVMRSNDPDLWRVVGWDDDPNHFIDFGVPEYGPYPFAALPREYGDAVQKFGAATVAKYGLLPWREAEEFGNLRRGFEGFTTNMPYAAGNTVLFAAVAAHYIQDAHQPLHATNNYDGQLSGQFGIHSRFESALFERFSSRMTIAPEPVPPMRDPRQATFDILLTSYRLVAPVLRADEEAVAGKDTYDDEYFETFFARVKPMLERQITAAISETAAMIVGAWEAAGRPALAIDIPRPVQKVRRPR